MRSLFRPALVASAFALLSAAPASALIQIDIFETGSGVTATYSGSIDVTGLEFTSTQDGSSLTSAVFPGLPFFLSIDAASFDGYNLAEDVTPWEPFGAFTSTEAFETSGDAFGFAPGEGLVGKQFLLPAGYVSGATLSGSMSFLGATLASMGITAGSYSYALPADTIQLTAGASPVPLPAAAPLLAAGLGGLALLSRRRRG